MGCHFDPKTGKPTSKAKDSKDQAKVKPATPMAAATRATERQRPARRPAGISIHVHPLGGDAPTNLGALLDLIMGATPDQRRELSNIIEGGTGEGRDYDFDGHTDPRYVHIPDGKHRDVAAAVHAATKRIIREAAGVKDDDDRSVCPGCIATALDDAGDRNSAEFASAGRRARPPGEQVARMIAQSLTGTGSRGRR